MKKNALIIAIVCCVAIVCLIAGYFAGKIGEVSDGATDEKPITSETAAKMDWGENEPEEYPEFEWPSYGMATDIPIPDWSVSGEVYINYENYMWIYVGYTTYDDFEQYFEKCKEFGWAVNTHFSAGGATPFFYAEDEKGHAIKVYYYGIDHSLLIQGNYDASYWTKYWLEED